MLRIDIQSAQQQVTLRCSGKIVLGVEGETLFCMATSRKEGCLRLDLSGIHRVDACGLGILLELRRWANGCHKILRITDPSPQVRRLLALTNLQSILDIEYSVQAAAKDERAAAPLRTKTALTA